MKYRFLALCCAAVLSCGFFTGCGSDKEEKTTESSASAEEELSDGEEAEDESEKDKQTSDKEVNLDVSQPLSGIHHAEMVIKDYGTIEMELDADTAPITVTNFVKLVQEDFYNGLTFHRIIEGFMMQGGDPLGSGIGGSEEKIKGEFTNNGVDNNISHERGTISMARSSDPNSASSQFFIMHQDGTYLDGDYAAFGHVTSGMDVVDKICEEAEPVNSNGLVDTSKQPVIESISIID